MKFNRLPSEILGIEDEYTAFCFNETCMFISTEMENGNKPKWEDEKLTIEEERCKASSLADELRKKGGKQYEC